MPELPQMYTVSEFHAMFPALETSCKTWYRWLSAARTSTPPQLIINKHWMYTKFVGIAYLPKPVFCIILQTPEETSPFHSRFHAIYGKHIKAYISGRLTSLDFLTNIDESSE
jgi:hypothetical protein